MTEIYADAVRKQVSSDEIGTRCPCGHEFEQSEWYWYHESGLRECEECHGDHSQD